MKKIRGFLFSPLNRKFQSAINILGIFLGVVFLGVPFVITLFLWLLTMATALTRGGPYGSVRLEANDYITFGLWLLLIIPSVAGILYRKYLTGIAGVTLLVVSSCMFMLKSCDAVMEKRDSWIPSPNGKHSARTTFRSSCAVCADITSVELKSNGSMLFPHLRSVFSWDISPYRIDLRWDDDTHLVLVFSDRPVRFPDAKLPTREGKQQCSQFVNGIHISCADNHGPITP